MLIITYTVFSIVLILALLFDLGLLSKNNKTITIKNAIAQTLFWVALAIAFFVFLWINNNKQTALEYISAYVMEWSLSVDNIFVFILIFSSLKIPEKQHGRALLFGILTAIVLRVLFITIGVSLIEKANWILYIFGIFLLYTGYKMFFVSNDEEYNPTQSKVFLTLQKVFSLDINNHSNHYSTVVNGKKVFTALFAAIVLLGFTDLLFALDSLPAVIGISQNKLVIYTSNIFAVLGLRSLFFILKTAATKFDYLQQGIAIVLVFIGIKMLFEHYINLHFSKNTQIIASLMVILACITSSILFSWYKNKTTST